jgi:adenylate cyclase, class 2
MKATRGSRENEVKLRVHDAAGGRRLLRRAGFRVSKARVFESNDIFDTGDRRIIGAGGVLRLREVNGRGTLTYKGAVRDTGRHKSREEIETDLDDPAAARLILERLGYRQIFRYEKFRTEFARPAEPGHATLDETPIGVFIELEGPPRWVDRTARSLGFTAKDYITRSYGRLYLDDRATRGKAVGNMVFGRSAARTYSEFKT